MSFLHLPLFCVKVESRTIEVQYSTVSLHRSSRCCARFRALRLLRLPHLPSNWLCHNHSITSTEYRYFQRRNNLLTVLRRIADKVIDYLTSSRPFIGTVSQFRFFADFNLDRPLSCVTRICCCWRLYRLYSTRK